MSLELEEARIEEVKDTVRLPKCRIPRRAQNSKLPRKVEEHWYPVKPNIIDVRSNPQSPRTLTKCVISRPYSTETRPRSVQNHEEKTKNAAPHRVSASDRVRRLSPATAKILVAAMLKVWNMFAIVVKKFANRCKKAPSKRKEPTPTLKNRTPTFQQNSHMTRSMLLQQDVTGEYNEPELPLNFNGILVNATEEDAHANNNMTPATEVMLNWQKKMLMFDKMKSELESRQNKVMELYAALKEDQRTMAAYGQQLPSAEELNIMNVARMTPSQLFQLYTGSKRAEDTHQGNGNLNVDVNKFYDMPNNIIAVCNQTLAKRKEIIDWFESLKREEKGISTNKLTKKINEFNAENEMLKNTLQTVKAELYMELDEVVGYLRKNANDTVALQLRTEDLTYDLSELNSMNADLRKQLHTADNLKSPTIKHKIEELEKELKEEKCNKKIIRDRLTRAEGQMKISYDRALHLEAIVEQARSQNWALERTVQQLHDQNGKLQSEFDKELNKLTESIRVNTVHLEEIAKAREKLQTEKEELEKRLDELSDTYKRSLEKMQQEANLNSEKFAEAEKRFDDEKEERQNLDIKLKSLCAQLYESELRYKDALNQLQEKEIQYNEAINSKNQLEAAAQKEVITVTQELEAARQDLGLANIELDDYRKRLMDQGETIREIEHNLKETINLERNLTNELKRKEKYIEELVKKQAILEQQLEEGESKMESYEKQLTSLKNHIAELRKDFGEFENLTQLHDMMNQQRTKLLEATQQCSELVEALERKDLELERHLQHISEQETLLDQRNDLVKILKDKEEDQNNMIKLLRDNLEIRAQADTELSQQVAHKNKEIEALIATLETRKQQILQLEKIILTLEDQLRKINSQRRKDQERINLLDKALNELETSHLESNRLMETPVDNLDNLIKILEDELDTSFEHDFKDREAKVLKKPYFKDRNKGKLDKYERQDGDNSLYQAEHDKMPTKIVMGNFVKKTYMTSNDEQYKGDLDRKKAITNAALSAETGYGIAPVSNVDMVQPYKGMIPIAQIKDQCLSKNFQFLMSNQRNEKKCKMFKLAGHRL